MAENGTGSFLVILLCAVMIVGGLANLITSNVITFSSQARIYPPVRVLYSEFTGSTTNFSSFDEDGLRAITNLTLESPGVGKVIFDGATDITADKDEHNVIDIDRYAQFSENSLYIDTGNLTSLRESASIFMYGLGFTNPIVLVDGYVCPPTICQVAGYDNDTLVFRVTQFSREYSAQETPSEQPPGPSGGAAYPQRPLPLSNFSVNKAFIKTAVRQGETLLDSVTIENTGQTTLDFNLSVEGVADKVALSEEVFSLAPGKSKTITVAFTVMENGRADVYAGRLLVSAGGMRKAVLLVMEVKERNALFDVYLDLGAVPLEASPGTEVEADILLYNFGDLRPVDVTLYYSLRDFEGNELLYKHDTIAVEEQKDVKRVVRLPEDLKDGMYLFYARVEYGNQTASSSGIIKVARSKAGAPVAASGWEIIVAAAALILAVALFAALRRPGFRRDIRRSYGRLPDLHVSDRLRTARQRRERAEKVAEERRIERMEAEVVAEQAKKEREMLEERLEGEKAQREELSRRLREKKDGQV
jgi:hypothetical protein